MKKKYNHLFFDLDRTLWDFDRNTEETFREMYKRFSLENGGIKSFDSFYSCYIDINLSLWEKYRAGEIKKEILMEKRFYDTLILFKIDSSELASDLSQFYITQSPLKTRLFPYTIELLRLLAPHYSMHIITNGFEEIQTTKLAHSGLAEFFDIVITSEQAGYKKPSSGIFEYAFKVTGAYPENSIMIGDDHAVDIIGAKNAGMDQIFVDFAKTDTDPKATFTVNNLKDIERILLFDN